MSTEKMNDIEVSAKDILNIESARKPLGSQSTVSDPTGELNCLSKSLADHKEYKRDGHRMSRGD